MDLLGSNQLQFLTFQTNSVLAQFPTILAEECELERRPLFGKTCIGVGIW